MAVKNIENSSFRYAHWMSPTSPLRASTYVFKKRHILGDHLFLELLKAKICNGD